MLKIHHTDKNCQARTGTMILPHGDVATPAFMPVGTNGAVKAIYHSKIEAMDTNLILANTYHLYLRPGMEVLKKVGGLHNFANWPHNILTDSGGYQVFSLAPFRKITDEGVKFRSHIDGSYHFLTPEKVVEIQTVLGSDIMMPLDVCTGPEVSRKEAEKAVKITTDWAKRSVAQRNVAPETYQGKLFTIVQGNFHQDLRRQSAEEIVQLDTPGIAIGGLSVGESAQQFFEFVEFTSQLLPVGKPRYVMGIGTPDFILAAVENGIDIFDCVYPTRIARNGTVFSPNGMLDLKKAPMEFDFNPIDETCPCEACRRYNRAYLRQLFKANEILGPMLATEHNLYFMKKFMDDMRKAINEDRFLDFKKAFLTKFDSKKAKA